MPFSAFSALVLFALFVCAKSFRKKVKSLKLP